MIYFIKKHKDLFKTLIIFFTSIFLILLSFIIFWISTFKIPTPESVNERRVSESTKIYDKTGEFLLYDTGGDTRRSIVSIDEISPYIKNATIAIEDKEFYTHIGIKPKSFLRAVLVNLFSLNFSQGGSTITQQVVKNSILTSEKLISRKLKEWVIAIKLEKTINKNQILEMYLNEIPYGGVIYGVEEASQNFFNKDSSNVSLAEAAYLAALPKAPSFYSPYGKNRQKLDERKNLVLKEMFKSGFITEEELEEAKKENVVFINKKDFSIKAPHFIFYIIEILNKKYGEDFIKKGGLKITTSLDYKLQEVAEKTVFDYATENKKKFNAENGSLIAIDPKNGDILTMVGSRNYFDKEIDGAFNVVLAKRQPGSTFKPFVYAEAFKKGYTPETVLFDVKTQFSTSCKINDLTTGNGCYAPENYDNLFRGPVTLRNALAQSLNIPSVKVLYLAGLNNSIKLAKDMGMESLKNSGDYGLTLVLGGGEVTPLEITSAYGVFANNGIKSEINPIIEIKNKDGNILYKKDVIQKNILDKEIALKISNILSDNNARAPAFGFSSALYFENKDVAVKTGTTNDYKDAWIIGYTPNIVVGAWAGNNNNTPMEKKVAGFIVAPMWRSFMNIALNKINSDSFEEPLIENQTDLKPVLRGVWQGGIVENNTIIGGVHSILNWVDKDNPRGEYPSNPFSDPQLERWEYGVQKWAELNNFN